MVAEYRSSSAETITYRDKVTGKAAVLKKLTHQIELGATSVQVNERVGEDFQTETFKPPFRKGQQVVFKVESLLRDKGVYKGSGTLEILTDA